MDNVSKPNHIDLVYRVIALPVKPFAACGIDIGGSKGYAEGGERSLLVDFTGCESIYEAIAKSWCELGFRPGACGLSMAGAVTPGQPLELTNRGWPNASLEQLEKTFGGTSFGALNDMSATGRGFHLLEPGEVEVLRPASGPTTFDLLVSVGTGVGIGPDSEGGHVSFTGDLRFVHWLRNELGQHRVEAEDAIGGAHGWYRMYRYMCSKLSVSPYLRTRVEDRIKKLAREGEGREDIADIIIEQAFLDDEVAWEVVWLFAAILGETLRNAQESLAASACCRIIMDGSIMRARPGFASFVVNDTEFLSGSVPSHNQRARESEIVLVNTQRTPALGAYDYARTLLAA